MAHNAAGREIAAHPLAYDQVTGFGLVLPLQKLNAPPVPLGSSAELRAGSEVHVLSAKDFGRRKGARLGAARICRRVGISARGSDIHRTGSPALVRRRLDRRSRHAGGIGIVAGPRGHRGRGDQCEYVRAHRLAETHPAKSKVHRPSGSPAAAVARECTQSNWPGRCTSRASWKADLRRSPIFARETSSARWRITRSAHCRIFIGASGRWGRPVPACRLTAMRGATQIHLNVRSVDRGELLKRPQAH